MLRLIVFKMHADSFQPEKLLAVGPAAKVYRGIETATGRKVLLKVLLQDYEASHPLDREKLQLLAPTLLQLRHPQIAGLITLLPTEDEFALVYEFTPVPSPLSANPLRPIFVHSRCNSCMRCW